MKEKMKLFSTFTSKKTKDVNNEEYRSLESNAKFNNVGKSAEMLLKILD
jgi:hypothetical protein